MKVRETVFRHVWLPVINEYVEWVLDDAVKSGKKRLYFLARDGYMMYLMAQKLVNARKLDIELRYLKVSRYAIRNAEYYFAGKDALDTLCMGGIDITFEKIMKRARLSAEEAHQIARLAGWKKRYKEPLNYRQLQQLKRDLLGVKRLFLYIRKHSKVCYKTTVAYLRQEGLFDKVPYALVDSGWVGSLQFSIQKIINHETERNIRLQGYYFGIYERPKGTEKHQYKAFYFDEKQIKRKVRFSNCLFETVCSAPEGMTYGYKLIELTDGNLGYTAIEDKVGNPNAEVIGSFVKLLLEYAPTVVHRSKAERIRHVSSLLEPLMSNPTRNEAKAFGELLFCDDVLELRLQPLAAKWSEKELRQNRFFNKILIALNLKSDFPNKSAWVEGSITRLGIRVRENIRQEHMYKSLMYMRKAFGK